MKIKSLFLLLLFPLMFSSCSPQGPNSGDTPAPTEGLEYHPIDETTCAVSVGSATDVEKIVIPETYNNYKVIEILDEGFKDCNAKSVIMPNSIVRIGFYAFQRCELLTSIVVPDSVVTIDKYAFHDCSCLTSLTFGSGLTSIGARAFYSCTALTSVELPKNLTSIGKYAFYSCLSLESITIPNSVTVVGESAFLDCDSLNYSEYDNCKYLGNEDNPYYVLVEVNEEKQTYEIHSHCRVLMGGSFNTYGTITSLILPDNLISIGEVTFAGCRTLTSINIPISVSTIGSYAFSGCFELTINCEAQEKPAGWDKDWNPNSRPVNWGVDMINL